MCWDNSLNKDCDDIAMRHVAATILLPKDDPRKFSFATPNQVSNTYRRLFNNPPVFRDGVQVCPSKEGGIPPVRIGQDICKVIPYWRQIFESKGVNINTNTNGHRGDEARAAKVSSRGGYRKKKTLAELTSYWIHPDAREAMKTFEEDSKNNFKSILARIKKESGTMTQPKEDCYAESESIIIQEEKGGNDLILPNGLSDGEDSEQEDDQL
jgi:hypothetical protein